MQSLSPHSRAQSLHQTHQCGNVQHLRPSTARVLCRSTVVDALAPLQLQPQQLRQIEQACGTIQPDQLQNNLKELTSVYLLKVGECICCWPKPA
jgi:hypothetical protein